MKHSILLALLISTLVLLTGCKEETGGGGGATGSSMVHKVPPGTTLRLAFVSNNADPFWNIAAAGIHKYESENPGIKVDIKNPPSGKIDEQIQFLETLISQGYHGIAVSVIAPQDETPLINRAAERCNVICTDSDAQGSKRLLYLGTNNYEAGKVLGGEIAKMLPDGGQIAIFVGTKAADNAKERARGVIDATKDHKITVVNIYEDNKDDTKARSNVEQAINAYPELKLLCGLWAYNGPAIAAALEASGKKGQVKAAVFDESDGTLDGIEKGSINCTVVQKPYDFGYRSSKILHDLCTKGEDALKDYPKDRIIDTGVDVINSQNVKEFRSKLNELKKG